MLNRISRLTFGFCFFHSLAIAQAIDNMASFRMIDAGKYVRLHYENDYFTSTDYYYTQGINLEIVNPAYRRFPLSKLLFAPKNSTSQYGISIEHNGYTPTSIRQNDILYGDRPFAAALLLKTFSTSSTDKHYRITSSLSLGVIGQAAGGREMQTTIHRWIKDDAPLGWQHQIQNDIIVNYEAGIEKTILQTERHFIVNGLVQARAGTLDTRLSSGFVLFFGKLNSAITSVFSRNANGSPINKSKSSLHLYAQPMIHAVAYNATLGGGLFNRNSPYILLSKEIERLTYQGNYGLVFQNRSLYLEYFQSILSREFKTGLYHRWGGIRMGVKW